MFGNHGLDGLLEEGAHEKSPKCLGGNLGDFVEFCKGLSKENRQHLKDHQLLDGIMRKAQRNRPLTEAQTKRNRYLSKTRYVVEQSFGTLHRKFRYARAAYLILVNGGKMSAFGPSSRLGGWLHKDIGVPAVDEAIKEGSHGQHHPPELLQRRPRRQNLC